MTGFGTAERTRAGLHVRAEVKSVNNRHLKVSVRCPHGYTALEHDLERLVREQVARGTLHLTVFVHRSTGPCGYVVDEGVFRYYLQEWRRLSAMATEAVAEDAVAPPDPAVLLSLPGVVREDETGLVSEVDWPLIRETVLDAVGALNEFRTREGAAMSEALQGLCDHIDRVVEQIHERAPLIAADYRERLRERINLLLKETGTAVTNQDLIREVSLFADRCDVTEEVTRLRSHLKLFRSCLMLESAPGRKLDFLCQELFRESNTIGSKGNDSELAHLVVQLKSTIEKVREIVQNVE